MASALPGPLRVTTRAEASTPDAATDLRDVSERRELVERFVRDNHEFVWRCARRLGVREADVDDVVQEVFLAASKNIDSIEPGRERGYLFRTCVFASAHARRSVQRRREVVDEIRVGAEVDQRATPEQSAAESQARERLQAILDAMPEDFRVVFVLFELERVTMIDIAEMLGVPQGTVASRLRRAREIFMTQATAVHSEGEAR
ncbi:RNA polymerase sigma factor RpoE [Labilithrix luteola]|uniref:RNA polymerase sigma factor RpoE n=1 Tax=Labilithrix luteola TaxID=1391654 RepID=A0A0K1Q4C2_9BACT|nr:RNA polymerase sigma factor RpoE [Labilithrix luteola]